jgi:hypothetical protein
MALQFPNSPSDGDLTTINNITFKYTASKNLWDPVTPELTITSDTPPGSPSNGQTWFDTNTATLYVYYEDGTSSQWIGVTGPGGSGSSSSIRQTFIVTTGNIGNGSGENKTFSLSAPGYLLYKVETDAAAWVRLYTDTTARTNDSARTIDEDPINVDGLLTEVITTGAQTVSLAPGVVIYNNENPVTNNLPVHIVNRSGGSTPINVTITVVQIES